MHLFIDPRHLALGLAATSVIVQVTAAPIPGPGLPPVTHNTYYDHSYIPTYVAGGTNFFAEMPYAQVAAKTYSRSLPVIHKVLIVTHRLLFVLQPALRNAFRVTTMAVALHVRHGDVRMIGDIDAESNNVFKGNG